MNEKVTGYTLLIAGVLLIIFSVFSVILVFTGVAKPAQLFNSKGVSFDLSSMVGVNLQALQNPNSQSVAKPTEILPADLINSSTNLFVHLLFMGFIASSGFKLASLGVQMLRPITVKLKSSDGKETNAS